MAMASTAVVTPDFAQLPAISDAEFSKFQRFIYEAAGITLAAGKKILVTSRLARRLQHCECTTYAEYLHLLASGQRPEEVQIAVDLLTTNETYFFREPRHFEFLREQVRRSPRASPPRVWSAAGSTGEEAYSIAMVLEDCMQGHPWEVIASDISVRVIAKARAGHYPMERARNIPLPYLQRFCLKGDGRQEQTLLVERSLRNKVRFLQVNLNAPLPNIGKFDFVFLRNVLIYFNADTKRDVVARVLGQLKPGGWLFIGHSENLRDITDAVTLFAPSIFQKR
jgi:chemotaxis protein methyltransferase CheR